MFSKFAGDIKWGVEVDMPEHCSARELDMLEKWADRNLMKG